MDKAYKQEKDACQEIKWFPIVYGKEGTKIIITTCNAKTI
jgi:hypothetical protein